MIEGQAYLGSADQRQPQVRLQLHLVGQPDSPTKEQRYVLRTNQDGSFRFGNVMPGFYMLTDKIAGEAPVAPQDRGGLRAPRFASI